MREILAWVLPAASDAMVRRQAAVVVVACLCLMATLAALAVFWRLTRDLESKTALVFGGLGLVLAGDVALAHGGHGLLAGWLLAGALLAIVSLIVGLYGTDGPVMAWFLAPILVLAGVAGIWAALGAGVYAAAVIWLSALAQQSGRFVPPWSEAAFHRMVVTFNVPIMTALYLLTAVTAGAIFGL